MFYPATFDTAGFDYSYFDILSKKFSQMLAIHEKIIADDKENVTLIRETDVTDADGRIISSTETSDEDVEMKIQPINEEERNKLPQGVSVTGYMKAYVNSSYDLTNLGDSTRISVGDIIVRTTSGDIKYRVEKINRFFMGGGEIYRKIFMQRLNS